MVCGITFARVVTIGFYDVSYRTDAVMFLIDVHNEKNSIQYRLNLIGLLSLFKPNRLRSASLISYFVPEHEGKSNSRFTLCAHSNIY